MTRTTLNVEGMSCSHCKAAVEDELGKLSGVRAEADVDGGVVEVSYEDSRVSFEQLREAVERAGYTVTA